MKRPMLMAGCWFFMIVAGVGADAPAHQAAYGPPKDAATFSIVAFDSETGDLGIAVQSKFFGVGSVVPWARAGVGAVATQARVNIAYGPEGLALLGEGRSSRETLGDLIESDPQRQVRQLGIVDARGQPASFTGDDCHAWAGHFEGDNFCVQGNILAGPEVIQSMVDAFLEARRNERLALADWLMAALRAGQDAGGDKRGQQSAALLVVREKGDFAGVTDRFIDLRVEDHPEPIEELARLLEMHKQFFAGAHQRRPKHAPAPANDADPAAAEPDQGEP